MRPATTPQPPLALRRVVVVLSLAYTATSVLAAWHSSQPDRVRAETGEWIPLATFIVCLAVWFVTCHWLDRSRVFARAVAPGCRQVRGTAGTWLGWWLPIVELWFPYQAVRDVRVATSGGRRRSGLLALWWPSWLVHQLAMRQVSGVHLRLDRDTAMLVALVALVALAVALLPWLTIVRSICSDQRARLAEAHHELVAT